MKIPKAESKTVEFKTAFNQDVIVSLVSFANADGGDVYVGVRGDGNVVGVQLAAESETTWINEIKSKTAPAIVPEADRIAIGKKTVVRLHIAPLPVKPTSVQGRYYIRKAKSNHLMTVAELSDMYLKSTSSSWDAFPSGKTPGSEVARGGTLNGTLSGTLNASDRRVLEYIDANPRCRASAIIAEVSIPRDTLNKIIARLAKAGKVERRGSKKTGGYYAKG